MYTENDLTLLADIVNNTGTFVLLDKYPLDNPIYVDVVTTLKKETASNYLIGYISAFSKVHTPTRLFEVGYSSILPVQVLEVDAISKNTSVINSLKSGLLLSHFIKTNKLIEMPERIYDLFSKYNDSTNSILNKVDHNRNLGTGSTRVLLLESISTLITKNHFFEPTETLTKLISLIDNKTLSGSQSGILAYNLYNSFVVSNIIYNGTHRATMMDNIKEEIQLAKFLELATQYSCLKPLTDYIESQQLFDLPINNLFSRPNNLIAILSKHSAEPLPELTF